MTNTFKVILSAVAILSLAIFSQAINNSAKPENNKKALFIVDTDIGPWPDDVGALAMLHTYADRDLLDIVAIMSNNKYEGAVSVIDALNVYFNRSSISIGITKDPAAMATSGTLGWPEYILAHYPHPNYVNNSQAEDAVQLYRRLLAQADEQSITILSIGYLNNLAGLLGTGPDSYSTASGIELVRSKVKQMFVMAGTYPNGTELNIQDQPAAAIAALPNWPTPATFIGFEAGDHIACGGNLLNFTTNSSILTHSPISKAFELAYKVFHHIDGCYDETGTLVALETVLGNGSKYFDNVPGMISIFPNGTNVWHNANNSKQVYVKQKASVTYDNVVNAINPLLVR